MLEFVLPKDFVPYRTLILSFVPWTPQSTESTDPVHCSLSTHTVHPELTLESKIDLLV